MHANKGSIADPKSFLTAIGRGCQDVADKFQSWDHLFTVTSDQMKNDLGIATDKRRYILGWREWFKRGIEPTHIEIPKRSKKYLKLRAAVKLNRLKKQGLA